MHNVAQHAPRDRGVHISTPEVLMCTRRSASARHVTLNTAPLACDRSCTAGLRPIHLPEPTRTAGARAPGADTHRSYLVYWLMML